MKSLKLSALLVVVPLTAFACSQVARDYQAASGNGGGSTTTTTGHGGPGSGAGTSSSNTASGGSGGSPGTGGNGATGGSGGSGGTVDEATACADFASTACAGYEKCAPDIVTGAYGDLATCKARYAIFCSTILEAPGTSWTPEGYEKCSTALAGASCAEFLISPFTGGPAACLPQPGNKMNNASCIDSGQCKSAYCRHVGGVQCGTCVDRGMVGDACATITDCKSGLKCNTSNVCALAVAPGGMCTDTNDCVFGYGCYSNMCQLPGEPGQTCASIDACNGLEALFCNGSDTPPICDHASYGGAGASCGFTMTGIDACAAAGFCGGMPGVCIAAAMDGQMCGTMGPNCMNPAECVNGVCTIAKQSNCN